MGLGGGLTMIETVKWEELRKKLYLPVDVDEYASSSKPLVDFTLAFLSEVLPYSKKPLKEGYVADVCRDGCVSPCALIMGLIYIQRLAQINSAYLSRTLPSDVFLVALVVASKYLQDEGESEALVNSEWATVGQKSKPALDKLEREFLNAIDWNLYVSVTEYDMFTSFIQGRIACMEAVRRGWWSYSDLISHWDASDTTDSMINASVQTTKVFTRSFATYLLCVTAIVSASHITMETKNPSPPTSSVSPLLDPDYVPNGSSCLLSTPLIMNTGNGQTTNTDHMVTNIGSLNKRGTLLLHYDLKGITSLRDLIYDNGQYHNKNTSSLLTGKMADHNCKLCLQSCSRMEKGCTHRRNGTQYNINDNNNNNTEYAIVKGPNISVRQKMASTSSSPLIPHHYYSEGDNDSDTVADAAPPGNGCLHCAMAPSSIKCYSWRLT